MLGAEEEAERVEGMRTKLETALSAPNVGSFHGLLAHLQAVRGASRRTPLTPSQIALIHREDPLILLLLDLAKNPLTFHPDKHTTAMIESQETDMEVDDEKAENYLRQFAFPTKEKLLKFLKEVVEKKPQYRFVAARIESGLGRIPHGQSMSFGCGGHTVATNAV